MGLFDKMFGKGATELENQPESQQQFNQLKQKYGSVLRMIEQNPQVQLRNLHVEGNKLVIRGSVSSSQAKNQIWDQIKLVDPTYSDLMADLEVHESAQGSVGGSGTSMGMPQGGQTYTVKPGDTLSKISKQFYGDASDYMHIFNANRDKLTDPNLIQVGQILTIPPQ